MSSRNFQGIEKAVKFDNRFWDAQVVIKRF